MEHLNCIDIINLADNQVSEEYQHSSPSATCEESQYVFDQQHH